MILNEDQDEALREKAEELYQAAAAFLHAAETGESWSAAGGGAAPVSALSESERLELDAQAEEDWGEPRRGRSLGELTKRAVAVCALVAAFAAAGAIWSSYRDATTLEITDTATLVRELPQRSTTLGQKPAEKVLVYADPADPYTRNVFTTALPDPIESEVASGQLKLQLVPWPGTDPSGSIAGRAILAAAQQDKAWSVGMILMSNPQTWSSDTELVRALQATGLQLNYKELATAMAAPGADNTLAKADKQTRKLSVSNAPVFVFDPGSKHHERVVEAPFGAGQLASEFERAARR